MPLAFFYIFVVMPLKKRIRCSELVEGTIKWIDKEVRTSYDSEGRHHHGVFYIATCEYYYGGKEYTSTVESMNKKFKVSKGEVLQFHINPKNPLETYYRNAKQVIKMFKARNANGEYLDVVCSLNKKHILYIEYNHKIGEPNIINEFVTTIKY